MPRITCQPCGASFYSAASSAHLRDPNCPDCGVAFPARASAERFHEGGSPEPIPAAGTAPTRLELQR